MREEIIGTLSMAIPPGLPFVVDDFVVSFNGKFFKEDSFGLGDFEVKVGLLVVKKGFELFISKFKIEVLFIHFRHFFLHG